MENPWKSTRWVSRTIFAYTKSQPVISKYIYIWKIWCINARWSESIKGANGRHIFTRSIFAKSQIYESHFSLSLSFVDGRFVSLLFTQRLHISPHIYVFEKTHFYRYVIFYVEVLCKRMTMYVLGFLFALLVSQRRSPPESCSFRIRLGQKHSHL